MLRARVVTDWLFPASSKPWYYKTKQRMPFISRPPRQMLNIRLSRTPQHDTNVTWLHFVLCMCRTEPWRYESWQQTKACAAFIHFPFFRRFNPHNPTRVWMENKPSSHTSFCRISTYFMCSVCLGFLFSFLQVLHILFPTPWCNLSHLQPFFFACEWTGTHLKGWFAQNNDERRGFK